MIAYFFLHHTVHMLKYLQKHKLETLILNKVVKILIIQICNQQQSLNNYFVQSD